MRFQQVKQVLRKRTAIASCCEILAHITKATAARMGHNQRRCANLCRKVLPHPLNRNNKQIWQIAVATWQGQRLASAEERDEKQNARGAESSHDRWSTSEVGVDEI